MFNVFSILGSTRNLPIVEKNLGKLSDSCASSCAETVTKSVEELRATSRVVKASKIPPKVPSSTNYQAYAQINPKTPIRRLYRRGDGYAVHRNSTPLEKYVGPRNKTDGFSTIIDENDFGGGWLEGDINTPLGTNAPHDCAILQLVNSNSKTKKQILFHVHPKSKNYDIRHFINTKFRNFDKVNILPGNHKGTLETVKKIVDAIDSINPLAPKRFYHLSSYAPEVVGYQGELSFIKNNYYCTANFTEVKQFFYNRNHLLHATKRNLNSKN